MMRSSTRIPLVLALVLLLAAPLSATLWTSAITDEGTVFVVRQATETSRLVLEVQPSEGDPFELTVPGTEGPEFEQAPSLTVEEGSAYLVWSARRTIHSALYVTSWSPNDGWSEVVEFSGDAFSTKVNPKIAVTRDEYLTLDEQGDAIGHQRAVIHLSWWDEGSHEDRPLYVTLSVVDGELRPFEKPLDLYALAGAGFRALDGPTHSLARDVALESGDQGIRIGFSDGQARSYGLVDVKVPAGSLEFLADEARAQVVIWGRENPGASRARMASHMLEFTYQLGKRLLAEDVAAYVAGQVTKAIAEFPTDRPLESVADEARAQVVIWGSRIHGGIRQLHQEARAQVVIWGSRYQGETASATTLLTRARDRDLGPEIPSDRQVRTFLGSDGVILAWDADATVRYVELDFTDPSSVTRTHSLSLSPSFPREEAYASLERRATRR